MCGQHPGSFHITSGFSEHLVLLQVKTLTNTFTGTDIVVNNYTSVQLNTESEAQLEVFNGSTHIGYDNSADAG
jgi:hypothetical protein